MASLASGRLYPTLSRIGGASLAAYYSYTPRSTTNLRWQHSPIYVCSVLARLFAIALLPWVARDCSSRLHYAEESPVCKPSDVLPVLLASILYGRCSDRSLGTFHYIVVYLAELGLAPRR